MTDDRPLSERPAARRATPTGDNSGPIPPKNGSWGCAGIGCLVPLIVGGIVVVAFLISIIVNTISSAVKDQQQKADQKVYALEVEAAKGQASSKCFADMANWLGQPLADNREVMSFQRLAATVKVQGVATGGQFTCIYDLLDNGQLQISQLAWDKMDGSAPEFFIP